ncbi:MAG: hypothetical protein HY548_02205 [Elusimicrobia bacterium]|nr:hypothetical protein [Elusimicrobiota bacterium]
MSRGEKITAFVLGVGLFAGLFFFIYQAVYNAPAPLDETAIADEEDFDFDEDFDFEEETEAPAETAAPQPPAAPAEKK